MENRTAHAGNAQDTSFIRSFTSGIFFVFMLAGGVFLGGWLLGYAKNYLPGKKSAGSTLANMQKGKKITNPGSVCKELDDGELRGAFRELDCLITIRRAFPGYKRYFEPIILIKMRKLHKRLKKESVDWRTAARWKFLYELGSRLYTVQNKWAENAPIPVYEVNGHHMALPFWIKEGLRKEIGPLFHFDTHNDMRAIPTPKQVLEAVAKLKHGRDVKNAWHTIAHIIYDCAMPVAGAVLAGANRNIIWGKPSWNGYPEFINQNFFFGRPVKDVPVGIVPLSGLKPSEKKKKLKQFKAAEKKRGSFRLYYDPTMNKGKKAIEDAEAWITIQPAQQPIRKKFELVAPFRFSIINTDMDLMSTGEGKGKKNFQRLLKAMPKGKFTLDLDLDYFASVDSSDNFKRKAGSDPDWDLDLFKKRRRILRKRLDNFKNLLIALKDRGRVPAVITIADSTYLTFALDEIAQGQSEYTPIEHTAFIRYEVRKIFRKIYGDKVIGRGRAKKSTKPGANASIRPDKESAKLLQGSKTRKFPKRLRRAEPHEDDDTARRGQKRPKVTKYAGTPDSKAKTPARTATEIPEKGVQKTEKNPKKVVERNKTEKREAAKPSAPVERTKAAPRGSEKKESAKKAPAKE